MKAVFYIMQSTHYFYLTCSQTLSSSCVKFKTNPFKVVIVLLLLSMKLLELNCITHESK